MMSQRIGRPPISTMGLGRNSVSSRRRVPNPLQRTTTFITGSLQRFGAGKAWLPPSAEWIGSDMHRCLSALAGGPRGTEVRQRAANLVAGHAITAFVRPAAGSVLHAASGYGFSDDVRQFADPVIFLGTPDIESLVVNM